MKNFPMQTAATSLGEMRKHGNGILIFHIANAIHIEALVDLFGHFLSKLFTLNARLPFHFQLQETVNNHSSTATIYLKAFPIDSIQLQPSFLSPHKWTTTPFTKTHNSHLKAARKWAKRR